MALSSQATDPIAALVGTWLITLDDGVTATYIISSDGRVNTIPSNIHNWNENDTIINYDKGANQYCIENSSSRSIFEVIIDPSSSSSSSSPSSSTSTLINNNLIIEHFDDEKNIEVKGKMVRYENNYNIGDRVLLSKDREGIIKYIGLVQTISDDILQYGIELSGGSIGEHNGTYQGKYYFHGIEQRCIFVDSQQIRRKMTEKDESSGNRQRRQESLQIKFDTTGKILKEEGQELGLVSSNAHNASMEMIAGVWDIDYNDGSRAQYKISADGNVKYNTESTSHWRGEITMKYDNHSNQYMIETEDNPSIYEVVKFKDPSKQDLSQIQVEYFDDENAISKAGMGYRQENKSDNNKTETTNTEEKKKDEYQVGDLVILTQDREGYIRYIGTVHYAEGIFYGIELIGGTMGAHRGTVKGKEYFKCRGNLQRGLMVKKEVIRKKMTEKDKTSSKHQRRQASLQSKVELSGTSNDAEELLLMSGSPTEESSPNHSLTISTTKSSRVTNSRSANPPHSRGENSPASKKKSKDPSPTTSPVNVSSPVGFLEERHHVSTIKRNSKLESEKQYIYKEGPRDVGKTKSPRWEPIKYEEKDTGGFLSERVSVDVVKNKQKKAAVYKEGPRDLASKTHSKNWSPAHYDTKETGGFLNERTRHDTQKNKNKRSDAYKEGPAEYQREGGNWTPAEYVLPDAVGFLQERTRADTLKSKDVKSEAYKEGPSEYASPTSEWTPYRYDDKNTGEFLSERGRGMSKTNPQEDRTELRKLGPRDIGRFDGTASDWKPAQYQIREQKGGILDDRPNHLQSTKEEEEYEKKKREWEEEREKRKHYAPADGLNKDYTLPEWAMKNNERKLNTHKREKTHEARLEWEALKAMRRDMNPGQASSNNYQLPEWAKPKNTDLGGTSGSGALLRDMHSMTTQQKKNHQAEMEWKALREERKHMNPRELRRNDYQVPDWVKQEEELRQEKISKNQSVDEEKIRLQSKVATVISARDITTYYDSDARLHKKSFPASKNGKYHLDDFVMLSQDRKGYIRYIGEVEFAPKNGTEWFGIELVEGSAGINNGTVGGVIYFECKVSKSGQRSGIFVTEKDMRKKITQKDKRSSASLRRRESLKMKFKNQGFLDEHEQQELNTLADSDNETPEEPKDEKETEKKEVDVNNGEYMIADGVSALDQIVGIWHIRYEDGTTCSYRIEKDGSLDRVPEDMHGWKGKVHIAYDPEVEHYAIQCEENEVVYEFVSLLGPNELEVRNFNDTIEMEGQGMRLQF